MDLLTFSCGEGLGNQDENVLGVSFGASLIHPRTVSKRIPRDSEWFEFGRGPGYADFQDGTDTYDFNHPEGRYIYKYSLSLETDPLALSREAQEAAVPPWVVSLPPGEPPLNPPTTAQSWLKIDNNNVFLTGCEWIRNEEGLDVVRGEVIRTSGKGYGL